MISFFVRRKLKKKIAKFKRDLAGFDKVVGDNLTQKQKIMRQNGVKKIEGMEKELEFYL
jgi:hypothetical protein